LKGILQVCTEPPVATTEMDVRFLLRCTVDADAHLGTVQQRSKANVVVARDGDAETLCPVREQPLQQVQIAVLAGDSLRELTGKRFDQPCMDGRHRDCSAAIGDANRIVMVLARIEDEFGKVPVRLGHKRLPGRKNSQHG